MERLRAASNSGTVVAANGAIDNQCSSDCKHHDYFLTHAGLFFCTVFTKLTRTSPDLLPSQRFHF